MLVLTGILVDDDTVKLPRKLEMPKGTEVSVSVDDKDSSDDEIQRKIERMKALMKEFDEDGPLSPGFDETIAKGIHFGETEF